MKDAVRSYEKAHDDYANRLFEPMVEQDVSPVACIVDVLRCSFTVESIEDLFVVIRRLLEDGGLVITMPNGHKYRVRVVQLTI